MDCAEDGIGRRGGRVVSLGECVAMADALRCDGRCTALRGVRQRAVSGRLVCCNSEGIGNRGKKNTMQYL